MIGFLILGFLIGLSHALEADHLAAVGAMAISGKSNPKRLAFLGASWGLGHTTTLFLLCSIVIGFGVVLSQFMTMGLEFMVGIMLVVLGLNVFWKMHKSKVHIHIHEHEDGKRHLHAHSHEESHDESHEDSHEVKVSKPHMVTHKLDSKETPTANHAETPHAHHHASAFSLRAYLVGLAHGAAGSAGLIALTAATTHDIKTALAYVLLFGLGSVIGMALLTFAISWPIRFSEEGATGIFKYIQVSIALMTIYIGTSVIMENGAFLWSNI